MVVGKLKSILDIVTSAAQAGERLVPLARRLGEMAEMMF